MTYSGNGHSDEKLNTSREFEHLGDGFFETSQEDEFYLVDSETVRERVDGFEDEDEGDNAESPN